MPSLPCGTHVYRRFSDLSNKLEYDYRFLFPVETETQKLNIYQFKAKNFQVSERIPLPHYHAVSAVLQNFLALFLNKNILL